MRYSKILAAHPLLVPSHRKTASKRQQQECTAGMTGRTEHAHGDCCPTVQRCVKKRCSKRYLQWNWFNDKYIILNKMMQIVKLYWILRILVDDVVEEGFIVNFALFPKVLCKFVGRIQLQDSCQHFSHTAMHGGHVPSSHCLNKLSSMQTGCTRSAQELGGSEIIKRSQGGTSHKQAWI